jgi:hypothetical protein
MKTIKLSDKTFNDLQGLMKLIIVKTGKDDNYTISDCIEDMVDVIRHEQETGEVDYIT